MVDIHRASAMEDEILEWMRQYQASAILGAAAQLGFFEHLSKTALDAATLARRCRCNARATRILLDALTALGLLTQTAKGYQVTPQYRMALSPSSKQCVLPMLHHQANCLRRWAELPMVVRTGHPAPCHPGVAGAQADLRAFIEAMEVVSRGTADTVVRSLNIGPVRCVLDVGGALGTWTRAWLTAHPSSRAIVFDLPEVVRLGRRRWARDPLRARVQWVAGDYLRDPLPKGADLVWISAVAHQNGREENRRLFRAAWVATDAGARLLVRDVIMEPDRSRPAMGALFAVNMLVSTRHGGTWTFNELQEDLEAAGWRDVRWWRRDEGMNSVIGAVRVPRTAIRGGANKSPSRD